MASSNLYHRASETASITGYLAASIEAIAITIMPWCSKLLAASIAGLVSSSTILLTQPRKPRTTISGIALLAALILFTAYRCLLLEASPPIAYSFYATIATLGAILAYSRKPVSLVLGSLSSLYLASPSTLIASLILAGLASTTLLELYTRSRFRLHYSLYAIGACIACTASLYGMELFPLASLAAGSLVASSLAETVYRECPFRREEVLVSIGVLLATIAASSCLVVEALSLCRELCKYCLALLAVGVLTTTTGFMAPRGETQQPF